MDDELRRVVAESRMVRLELRARVRERTAFALGFKRDVLRRSQTPLRLPDLRIATMASLVLEAHIRATREQNGATIDVLTDALEHLQDRLEREVLPSLS